MAPLDTCSLPYPFVAGIHGFGQIVISNNFFGERSAPAGDTCTAQIIGDVWHQSDSNVFSARQLVDAR